MNFLTVPGVLDSGSDSKFLDATINAGWTVDVCVKTGGATHLYTLSSSDRLPIGTETVDLNDAKDRYLTGISHVSWGNAIPPPPPPGDGTIIVAKVVDGDGDAPEGDFGFTLICDDGTSETFTLGDGDTDTFTREGGFEGCEVTETDDLDANATSWAITGDVTDSGSGTATGDDPGFDVDEDQTATVTFTNTFNPDDPRTFTVDIWKFWFDENAELIDQVPSTETTTLAVDVEIEGSEESETVELDSSDFSESDYEGVPGWVASVTLTVGEKIESIDETAVQSGYTEVDRGACLETTDLIERLNPDMSGVVLTAGQSSTPDWFLCNQQDETSPPSNGGPGPTTPTGAVTVEKVVDGDEADVPANAEFSFTLDCGNFTRNFTLGDGDSETFTGIAANATCTVDETEDQDADGTTWAITGDVVDSGTDTETDEFTVGSNDEVTVTFTNEFSGVLGEIEVTPDISIVKSAVDGVRVADDGTLEVVFGPGTSSKSVTYEFVITNTGEDDLTELTLMDDKIGDISEVFRGAVITEYGAAILPVGGSVTVTAIHDVSLDDFTNGTLTNVANVTGIGVDSERTVIDSDDETVVSIEVRGEIEEEPPVTPVVDTTETVETHPRTGFDTGALTGLGLLLAAIGAGVLLLGRRREEGDLS